MVQNKGILHIHLKEDILYKVVVLYKLAIKLMSILKKIIILLLIYLSKQADQLWAILKVYLD